MIANINIHSVFLYKQRRLPQSNAKTITLKMESRGISTVSRMQTRPRQPGMLLIVIIEKTYQRKTKAQETFQKMRN